MTTDSICGISEQDIRKCFEREHNRILVAYEAIGNIAKEFSFLPKLPVFYYEGEPPKAVRDVTAYWCHARDDRRTRHLTQPTDSLLRSRVTPKQIVEALRVANLYAARWEKKVVDYRAKCEAAAKKFYETQQPYIDVLKILTDLENKSQENSTPSVPESQENSAPSA